MESPSLITTSEAAKILNKTVRSIHNMISRGDLTKVKQGSKSFLYRDQVVSFLAIKEERVARTDEVAQLHQLLMIQNDYLIRLDARVALLESIIESRDTQAVLDATQLRVFKDMMTELLSKNDIEYSELQCWAADVNKLSFESAKMLGIQNLYSFVMHLLTVLSGDSEFLSGFDLHRVKDSLIMAKYKILGFSQLEGITKLENSPFIKDTLTKLSKASN